MAVAVMIEVFDPAEAAARGEPGQIGFNFRGMTIEQAEAALKYLQTIVRKLEDFTNAHHEVRG